jgi:uncharacterized protein YutE (UPF0331/DUF86 family)
MATSANCARSCPTLSRSYLKVEKRRACDLFEKLAVRGVVSRPMADTLRRMKGLRNVLVHEYMRVNDALVFETIRTRLDDFPAFKREVLAFLRTS